MNYDFALVTLKSAASASAGFMGMTVGQGIVTMNLTTAGYPVSHLIHIEFRTSGCNLLHANLCRPKTLHM